MDGWALKKRNGERERERVINSTELSYARMTVRYHDDSPSNLIENDVISMSSVGAPFVAEGQCACDPRRRSIVSPKKSRGGLHAWRMPATKGVPEEHAIDDLIEDAAFTQRRKYVYPLDRDN